MFEQSRQCRGLAAVILLTASLGGCAVYGPPYAAAYDPNPSYSYPAYGYPTYVGPPVTLDFGFDYYSYRHHLHDGHHGWGPRHGWGSNHGWSGHRRGRYPGWWGRGRDRH